MSVLKWRLSDSRRKKSVPGWEKHCRDKCRVARVAFNMWMNSAKVRSDPIYRRMKATRKTFRKSFKYFKLKEQQISDENMYDDFTSNRKEFWRKLKREEDALNRRKTVFTILRMLRKFPRLSQQSSAQLISEKQVSTHTKI